MLTEVTRTVDIDSLARMMTRTGWFGERLRKVSVRRVCRGQITQWCRCPCLRKSTCGVSMEISLPEQRLFRRITSPEVKSIGR